MRFPFTLARVVAPGQGTGALVFGGAGSLPLFNACGRGAFVRQGFSPIQPPQEYYQQLNPTVDASGYGGNLTGQIAFQPLLKR